MKMQKQIKNTKIRHKRRRHRDKYNKGTVSRQDKCSNKH